MTAAVSPNVSGPISIRDPAQRLTEYVRAAKFWDGVAQSMAARLVIVETTGYGARRLASESGLDSAQTWDFVTNSFQRSAGKGAVEAASLDDVIQNLLDVDRIFVKVTGRLIATNAVPILEPMDELRTIYIRMTYGTPWADTRLFAMSGSMWLQHFGGVAETSNDALGRYLEHEVGRCALMALANGVRISPFAARPRWSGASGSTGATYAQSRWSPRGRATAVAERLLFRVVQRKQL